MNEPVFIDAVEEDFDKGQMYGYLDDAFRKEIIGEAEEPEVGTMIEEIMRLSLEEECERYPWRAPNLSSGLDNRYSESKAIDLDFADGNPSIIAKMARHIASIVQFPENTAYLHGLGAFSSACVVNFEVEYNDKFIPTGMYTLCAQPSGSGKSSINSLFLSPISDSLRRRNIALSIRHKQIDAEIEAIEKKAEKAKEDPGIIREYARSIYDLRQEKLREPMVETPKKNTTPQAAEGVAIKQGGVMNVVSDESEAVDTYLGLSYTDAKTNPDHGVFMAAFGGDELSTARVSREGANIAVRGAFAVIAQYASVDTMIKAGAAGRGVSERCFIMREPHMIGTRKYSRDRHSIPAELKEEYAAICENILAGSYPLRLSMSEQCRDMIIDLKNDIEPQCLAGNKYGDGQIRGFASKIEQHITKMAAVFHICEQWNPKITKIPSREIQEHNLLKAMRVCMDLLDSYRALIESASTMGGSKLVVEVIGHMKRYALKGRKSFTIEKLRLSVAKEAWLKEAEGKKIDFLLNLLTRAEQMNFCHIKEDGKDKKKWNVLINPALKDFVIKGDE